MYIYILLYIYDYIYMIFQLSFIVPFMVIYSTHPGISHAANGHLHFWRYPGFEGAHVIQDRLKQDELPGKRPHFCHMFLVG